MTEKLHRNNDFGEGVVYLFCGCFATDVDECQADNGHCEQICVNSPGSFSCRCSEGHQLENDGKRCRTGRPIYVSERE